MTINQIMGVLIGFDTLKHIAGKKVNMKIVYARVSTKDQKLKMRLVVLRKAGCKKIFQEKVSGARRDRLEFNNMMEQLRDGDVIVVWNVVG